MLNTLQKGNARVIIFKEEDTWYGVVLESNIVETGDDPEIVFARVKEALEGYLESLKKIKGTRPQSLARTLNQKVNSEYEELWNKLQKRDAPNSSISDPNLPPVFFYGRMSPTLPYL